MVYISANRWCWVCCKSWCNCIILFYFRSFFVGFLIITYCSLIFFIYLLLFWISVDFIYFYCRSLEFVAYKYANVCVSMFNSLVRFSLTTHLFYCNCLLIVCFYFYTVYCSSIVIIVADFLYISMVVWRSCNGQLSIVCISYSYWESLEN